MKSEDEPLWKHFKVILMFQSNKSYWKRFLQDDKINL